MIAEWSTIDRYNDAILGSRKLRDALLFAQGKVPPDEPLPPVIRRPTRPRVRPVKIVREEAQAPCPCPICGGPMQPNRRMIAHVQAVVAHYYGLSVADMVSDKRGRIVAHPRQLAMFLASEITGKSSPEIGRRFGGRDHTTVIYAIKQVTARIESDSEIAVDVAALREALKG